MSRFYIMDLESVPLPEEELLKLMPGNIANPVMPLEIANPVMPEELAAEIADFVPPSEEALMEGCPAYKSKAHPEGDPAKREEYRKKALDKIRGNYDNAVIKIRNKREEWSAGAELKKTTWEEKSIEDKQRFIDDAALSAVTGSVKLIGIRDYVDKKTYVHVAAATADQIEALNAATYPCKTVFIFWATERAMLEALAMSINHGDVVPDNNDNETQFKIITFYGNYFDWPFIFRRAWITGAAAPIALRKGRYFNDSITTDLLDVWQLGDRQEKVGGMDGLAKALGTKRKSGTGEGFHRLWNDDPVAAVLYLLDDLDVPEEAAERMGAIWMPKPASTLPAKGKIR